MRNPYTRKAHRQRNVDPMGGLAVFLARQPIDEEKQTDVSIEHWAAFGALTGGASSYLHWRAIAASLNAALILAERGLGQDYLPYITAAIEAMHACQERAVRIGAWRFTGPDICAVREALQIVDEQIKVASRDQVRKALIEADFRARNGQAYPQPVEGFPS